MPFAVSLVGYSPSPRFDAVKWTGVHVFEAAAQDGAYAEIQTLAVPDYPDPAAPPAMSFTTTAATAESGLWYRLQFHDSNGVSGPLSAPVLNSGAVATVPTAAEVRAEWATAPLAEWGYPPPASGAVDPLDLLVGEAVSTFQAITGIDPVAEATASAEWAPLVRKAIRMLTVYAAGSSTPEVLDTAVDFDLISALTMGSYSETRRNLGAGRGQMHPWPALNDLLGTILQAATGQVGGWGSPAIGYPADSPAPGERQIYPRGAFWYGYQGAYGPFLPRPLSPGAIPV